VWGPGGFLSQGVQSGTAAPGCEVTLGTGGIQSNSVQSGIVDHQAGSPD
jgi:hypothetical protein